MIAGDIEYGTLSSKMDFRENDEMGGLSIQSKAGKIAMEMGQGAKVLMDMSQTVSLGPTTVHIDTDGLNGTEKLLLDLTMNRLSGDFTMAFPDIFDRDNAGKPSFSDALDAGIVLAAKLGYAELDGSFSFSEDENSASGTFASDLADMDLTLDRQAALYTAKNTDINITVNTSELPIGPLTVSASELSNTVKIPLNVTDDPAPFAYQDRYIDLLISENLWAMFDPEKSLPRGALTYILDITGMANWLVDPFDEQLQRSLHKGPKGELHSLTLNELHLTAAGVDLTGTGAFTLDNDDLETFDGFPAPAGALDLKLVGFNRLMDHLIKLGLLPENQALGARMGLGLLTVAGDGEDTLISHIEVKDDGKILANGKRLK